MSLLNIIQFRRLGDERGSLISIESNKNISFDIKRIYYIYGTKNGVSRGYHAHRNLKQIIICVSGSCHLILDNGKERESVYLNDPTIGLLVESLIWHEMYEFSPDCILLVLANNFYDENDYIRDYATFVNEINDA